MSQQPYHVVSATPTLDTSAYASGDRMGSVMTLTHGNVDGRPVTLETLSVLDKDDQGAAFDVLFFDEDPTIASSDNAALSITDAEMEKAIGYLSVATGDYADFGGARLASLKDVGLRLKPKSGSKQLYALCVSRGTPTHTASGLRLTYHFRLDRL